MFSGFCEHLHSCACVCGWVCAHTHTQIEHTCTYTQKGRMGGREGGREGKKKKGKRRAEQSKARPKPSKASIRSHKPVSGAGVHCGYKMGAVEVIGSPTSIPNPYGLSPVKFCSQDSNIAGPRGQEQ